MAVPNYPGQSAFRNLQGQIQRRDGKAGAASQNRPLRLADRLERQLSTRRRQRGDPEISGTLYLFRVAISDSRIMAVKDRNVTFSYRKKGSNRARHTTLDALEFIRRFLQHVLPTGFMKVRHYGFMSSNCTVPLARLRLLILEGLKSIQISLADLASIKRNQHCQSLSVRPAAAFCSIFSVSSQPGYAEGQPDKTYSPLLLFLSVNHHKSGKGVVRPNHKKQT